MSGGGGSLFLLLGVLLLRRRSCSSSSPSSSSKRQKIIFVCLLFLSCGVLVEAKKRDLSLFFFSFSVGAVFLWRRISLPLFWISLLKISPSFSLFSLSETRVVPSYFPRRTFTFTFKTHKFYHHYVIGCE